MSLPVGSRAISLGVGDRETSEKDEDEKVTTEKCFFLVSGMWWFLGSVGNISSTQSLFERKMDLCYKNPVCMTKMMMNVDNDDIDWLVDNMTKMMIAIRMTKTMMVMVMVTNGCAWVNSLLLNTSQSLQSHQGARHLGSSWSWTWSSSQVWWDLFIGDIIMKHLPAAFPSIVKIFRDFFVEFLRSLLLILWCQWLQQILGWRTSCTLILGDVPKLGHSLLALRVQKMGKTVNRQPA